MLLVLIVQFRIIKLDLDILEMNTNWGTKVLSELCFFIVNLFF